MSLEGILEGEHDGLFDNSFCSSDEGFPIGDSLNSMIEGEVDGLLETGKTLGSPLGKELVSPEG